MSLCYAEDGRKLCGACDCQRLDIMQHEEFKSSFDYVMQQLLPVIDQYTSDVNLQKNQWPSDYGYENVPEVIRGEEPELRPRSNFDRFSIKGVTDWWKNKYSLFLLNFNSSIAQIFPHQYFISYSCVLNTLKHKEIFGINNCYINLIQVTRT